MSSSYHVRAVGFQIRAAKQSHAGALAPLRTRSSTGVHTHGTRSRSERDPGQPRFIANLCEGRGGRCRNQQAKTRWRPGWSRRASDCARHPERRAASLGELKAFLEFLFARTEDARSISVQIKRQPEKSATESSGHLHAHAIGERIKLVIASAHYGGHGEPALRSEVGNPDFE